MKFPKRIVRATNSGLLVDPLHMTADQVNINDIAHHLAYQNRYGGSLNFYLSIAEHTVHLVDHFYMRGELENAQYALLHDAPEAYIQDAIRPLKRRMHFKDGDDEISFQQLDDKLTAMINGKYGLSAAIPEAVHEADTRIIRDEAAQGLPADRVLQEEFEKLGVEGLGIKMSFWNPAIAKANFLKRFKVLFANAHH